MTAWENYTLVTSLISLKVNISSKSPFFYDYDTKQLKCDTAL